MELKNASSLPLLGGSIKTTSGRRTGLVQIPCIERNAYAAARAMDAGIYALFTDGLHRVSFDHVVQVMKETGKDLPSLYKETSTGGLAKIIERNAKI